VDHGGKALVGLVSVRGNAFELLDLAEQVFEEMPPFVHRLVDDEVLCPARMPGDDNLGAARVEFGDNGVRSHYRNVPCGRVKNSGLDREENGVNEIRSYTEEKVTNILVATSDALQHSMARQ
jgi:hypothetical protein